MMRKKKRRRGKERMVGEKSKRALLLYNIGTKQSSSIVQCVLFQYLNFRYIYNPPPLARGERPQKEKEQAWVQQMQVYPYHQLISTVIGMALRPAHSSASPIKTLHMRQTCQKNLVVDSKNKMNIANLATCRRREQVKEQEEYTEHRTDKE